MISFKQFLSEDKTKTKSISAEDAIAWMEANAKNYLKNGNYLYRGFNNEGIQLGNSEDFTRKSVDGSPNYYTMWIDNSHAFKDFPKRSKSFICSTHAGKASQYGQIFFVIPKDQNKIGIVGQSDIWNVPIIKHRLDFAGIEYTCEFIFKYLEIEIDNYVEFEKALKGVNLNKLKELENKDYDFTDNKIKRIQELIKSMEADNLGSLYDFWNKFVTPDLFNQTTASNLDEDTIGEVWVQGECLFLSTTDSQLSPDDRDQILDWTDKYPLVKSFLLRHWLAT